jgi:phosphatidylethanolamine-binding protein (PEBP) family uncharacterized protein
MWENCHYKEQAPPKGGACHHLYITVYFFDADPSGKEGGAAAHISDSVWS